MERWKGRICSVVALGLIQNYGNRFLRERRAIAFISIEVEAEVKVHEERVWFEEILLNCSVVV
jgi:hypothetical protein